MPKIIKSFLLTSNKYLASDNVPRECQWDETGKKVKTTEGTKKVRRNKHSVCRGFVLRSGNVYGWSTLKLTPHIDGRQKKTILINIPGIQQPIAMSKHYCCCRCTVLSPLPCPLQPHGPSPPSQASPKKHRTTSRCPYCFLDVRRRLALTTTWGRCLSTLYHATMTEGVVFLVPGTPLGGKTGIISRRGGQEVVPTNLSRRNSNKRMKMLFWVAVQDVAAPSSPGGGAFRAVLSRPPYN